ncbi:MAG TPA: hypothetical protein VEL47_05935, partial [Myxococcota bacterium]|nr:hypothetical protein [Myxococcota bacterium]
REMFSTLMEQGLLDEIWWFHSPVDMGVLGLDLGYSADDLWRKSFQAYKTHRLGADELTIFRFIGGRREIPVDKYVK